jgi:origin recognition complex subunit 2
MMKRKRTASASPASGDTPTKPSTVLPLPIASSTPARPLPIPETPGKHRRIGGLQDEGAGLNGNADLESIHSPSPQKKPLKTPQKRDNSVRFADGVVSPPQPVTNADRSARRKSVKRIVSRAVTADSSDEEDEEDALARRIFADSDSEDEDGLLPEEEAPKKRGRKKKVKEPEPPPVTEGPDSFFQQNRKARQVTSNSTLASLPPLDHSTYFRLIRDHTPDHVEDRKYLEDLHRGNFPQWDFELAQGFNILLYGYGSKRKLLMEFAKHMYSSPRSLVIFNGYVPTLTIKDVLSTIAKALLGQTHSARLGSNPNDMLDAVLQLLDSSPEDLEEQVEDPRDIPQHITLMIHNIDGESLRPERCQVILSRLAAHPKLSIVASIDHIRAPLLWDAARASQFNFLWHDATTFAPYDVESSIDDSLALVGGSGRAGGTKGVKFVLASLPMNAKSLYRVLVSHQLQAIEDDVGGGNGSGDEYGVEYRVLYQKAMEEFICSNDMAFRTLLKEYATLPRVPLECMAY